MSKLPQQMTMLNRQKAHGYFAAQGLTIQFSRANGLPLKFEDTVPAQPKIPRTSMTEYGRGHVQDQK